MIFGCTATAGHLVGRFQGRAGTDPGDVDITFAAPSSFSGHFTYQGVDYPYSGTFLAHTPDDGCCPQSTGGGTTGGTTTGRTTTGGTTTGGGGTTGGGTGPGDCGASAAGTRAGAQTKPNCPPKPAVNKAEKDAATDKQNANLALMVVFCLISDPDEHSDICRFVIEMASFVGQIANDPPSRAFAHVHVAQVRRISPALSLFCPRGCPGAAGALNAYDQALARVDAALAGLVAAANRYSGARLVGSAAGMQLQAGLGQAYAGVLADALAGLTARASVFVSALTRAGVTTTLTTVQVSQTLTLLQNGLPAAYARRLPAGGDSATALAKSVTAAVGQPSGPVSVGQALALSPPPAAFRAASHAITVAELGAVVDQLGSQRAITRRARALLHTDLNAITRAGNAAAHARALARLRRDVNRLARTTRSATETLLQHAAAGLS